jgi:hypothetical protein
MFSRAGRGHAETATVIKMAQNPSSPNQSQRTPQDSTAPALWCATCARPVDDPLTCGDCSAVICRVCGTPLEAADELAFG